MYWENTLFISKHEFLKSAYVYYTRYQWSQQNINDYPDSKVHGANMGPIWGRQDPGGPHAGPMNLAI